MSKPKIQGYASLPLKTLVFVRWWRSGKSRPICNVFFVFEWRSVIYKYKHKHPSHIDVPNHRRDDKHAFKPLTQQLAMIYASQGKTDKLHNHKFVVMLSESTKRAYFPSSSKSWYSSVNLVQIVRAILTDIGGTEMGEERTQWFLGPGESARLVPRYKNEDGGKK